MYDELINTVGTSTTKTVYWLWILFRTTFILKTHMIQV